MDQNNRLVQRLDRLHMGARNMPLLQRFTVFTRLLLGLGFIAPGLTKVLGNRFTSLDISTPVGFFFEAFYQSGWYWRFIGAAQILAAVLTLIPRTTTLGALFFFPIILNIFVITVSLDFRGTPFITGAMLLANTYLLCWDYHKFKPLLFNAPGLSAPTIFLTFEPHPVERIGYALSIVAGMLLTLAMRGLFASLPRVLLWGVLGMGLVGGLMIVSGWLLLTRQHNASRWTTKPVH